MTASTMPSVCLRLAVATVCAIAVMLWAAPIAYAQHTQTSGDITWTLTPATDGAADDRISLRHAVDPGTTINDELALTNVSASEATFAVEAGDGIIGDGDAFDVNTDDPTDAGAWITVGGLSDGSVTVPAGETVILPLEIAVPADALPGDHPGGVVAGVSSGDGGVSMVTRIGVRLHLQVNGDIRPGLVVGDVSATFTPSLIPFAPGTLEITGQAINDGNVRLGAMIQADGSAGEPQQSGDSELLPGDSTTETLTVEAWPTFWTTATVTATPKLLGDDQFAAPEIATADVGTWAISWTGLAIIALVVISAALVIRRARQRRAGSPSAGA